MNVTEAMQARHSVRPYKNKALNTEVISALQDEITDCNRESGLHIQFVTNEPKVFEWGRYFCAPVLRFYPHRRF